MFAEPMARSRRAAGACTALGLACAVLIVLAPAPAWAQAELEVLGAWGGAVRTVFIDEAVDPYIAYVGSGRRLVILDVEDPENIVELGSVDVWNVVRDVKVRDGYAYVCTFWRPKFFCVVDVADVTAPRLVWSYQGDSQYKAHEVDLYGHYAFVRDDNDLDVFDISDPTHPIRVRRHMYIPPHFYPCDITIIGDLLYAIDDYKHLRILDLSDDPAYPRELASLTLPGTERSGEALAVWGGYAYAATMFPEGMLAVVDVSDPNAPAVVGSYDSRYADDVAARDGLVYLVDDGDLVVLDARTDPAHPTVLDTFETHGQVKAVEVVGRRVYAMDVGEGLIILDASGVGLRGELERLGSWHSPEILRKMDKVGDLLYLTDALNGMTILDVSDPLRPELVGAYQTGEDSGRWSDNWGIEVRDEKAYLSAGYGGIEIVDVSAPAQPTMLGAFRFNPGFWSRALTLNGDIAHVGVQPLAGGFLVNFDISDPNNIVDVGFVSVGSAPLTIDVAPGAVALIARDASPGGSLTNLNTFDPSDPYVIYAGQPGGVDLARAGNLLYMANDGPSDIGGVFILDVSEPNAPIEVGYWQLPASGAKNIDGVALRGQRVYAAARDQSTLYELDVTDPTAPVLVTETFVPNPQLILVDGRYAYVTTHSQGLTILELAQAIPGDLDDDGDVDLADLATLLANYGTPSGMAYEDGDLDGDEDVDLADLAGLLAHYGEGCD